MTKRIIDIDSGTVGPSHDPYGYDCLTVKVGARTAEHYSNGLDVEYVTLYEGGRKLRRFEYNPHLEGEKRRQQRLKGHILFRRHVGIDMDDALDEYNRNYEPDPMGHASRYI